MEPETDRGHKKARHILQGDLCYLRCRDIVTLQNMSKAGTSGHSSPLTTSHSSSVLSPGCSEEFDAQSDKNEQNQGDS